METVELEIRGDTALISLNNPSTLNGIDRSNLHLFPTLVEQANAEPEVAYIVVQGKNGSFCGGGSSKFLTEITEMKMEKRQSIFELGQRWITSLRQSPCLTVAAVDGLAAGAGFDLMLACDSILFSKNARPNFWYGKIGAIPDLGGLNLLAERIGPSRSLELYAASKMLTRSEIEALNLGVFLETVPTDVDGWASLLRRRYPITREAYGKAKKLMAGIRDDGDHLDACAKAQAELFESTYFTEKLKRVAGMQNAFHRRNERV